MMLKFFKYAAGGIVLIPFVHSRIATVCKVEGASMQPTINQNCHSSWLLIDRMTPLTKLKSGDIVLCIDPVESARDYIVKRIKALGGEFVPDLDVNAGDYSKHYSYQGQLAVPKGSCWLEGDRKDKSEDSRHHGPVPLGLIQGRVLLKLWPPGFV